MRYINIFLQHITLIDEIGFYNLSMRQNKNYKEFNLLEVMAQLFEGAIKNWQFTAKFIAISIAFFLIQFAYQFYFFSAGQPIEVMLIRTAAFSGAMFTVLALLSSILFKFRPVYAKYWTVRRALGVMGVVFILAHIYYAISFGMQWNLSYIFGLLDPFANPLFMGLIGIVFLFIVFLTSTDWAVQKLGGKWKTVQRLVYFGQYAMIFHFLLINPAAIMTPPGYILIALTALLLLGQLYWFVKITMDRKKITIGSAIGILIILLYLIGFYLAYFK